uniref:Uncharacterized protein n=1 Tax=Quercus lobata TaxID=97700 RepID=A0A7N2LHS7_QUELO
MVVHSCGRHFGGHWNFQAHALVVICFAGRPDFWTHILVVIALVVVRIFKLTCLWSSVFLVESSHIGPSRDEPREDSSSFESFKFSFEVGSSGYALEVNKHCSSLSDKRLAKLWFEFQIPHNVPTRIVEIDEKCYSHDGEAEGMYYFKCRKRERQLVTKIPSSNGDWKEKFCFQLGSDWPSDKRKFGVDTSLKPFGTITRPKETPSHPLVTPGCLVFVERPRAPGRGKGPLTPPKPPLLINDATYIVERVMSIIKEEDIDDCDEYAPTAIGESRLHDLAKGNNEAIKELQGFVTLLTEKVALLEGKVKELKERCSS